MATSYMQISQEEAKEMMACDDGHVVVDVRRLDEYQAGHIPGAICIPNESIEKTPPRELPDPDQVVLIYCRSGNRSKQAAQKLFDMGYTNVYEFGGIIDWDGEIVEGAEPGGTSTDAANAPEDPAALEPVPMLVIEINGERFAADIADNSSAEAFIKKLSAEPLTVELHDYGNFEKVGPLPWSLPTNDEQITTELGDVILYQGDQITIYYDVNSWSFTRLAKIGSPNLDHLRDALGDGDATAVFWVEWSE